ASLSLVPVPPATAGPVRVEYRPPVEGPLIDRFRPPASRFGPGNRGVDYATEPGTPVRAAGPGEVTFAGPVGGALHVVVLHADGIRTSYSFLAGVTVRRGQRVSIGEVVGRTGPSLHFGARLGDGYIDPLRLFDAGRRRVRLVPDRDGPAAAPAVLAARRVQRRLPVSVGSLEWARRVPTPQASPS
ncbi:MAG TPA: M23 family metallopeptidase, partial [Acidimicrobiales bacterium]|nr:M23 family metallopeptidase [Acidimicrobiales bacterium]